MPAAAKSLQSCPTLCDPIDGSSPGSPFPGILQARTLEWVAIAFPGKCLLGSGIYRPGVQDGFVDKMGPPERLHPIRKGLKIKIWSKLIFKEKIKEEKLSKINFIRMVREIEMKHEKVMCNILRKKML